MLYPFDSTRESSIGSPPPRACCPGCSVTCHGRCKDDSEAPRPTPTSCPPLPRVSLDTLKYLKYVTRRGLPEALGITLQPRYSMLRRVTRYRGQSSIDWEGNRLKADWTECSLPRAAPSCWRWPPPSWQLGAPPRPGRRRPLHSPSWRSWAN